MSVTSPITGRVTGIVASGVTRSIGHRTRVSVPFDADALTYIAAVEAADDATLEDSVKIAIDNFVKGCKSDGIWTAIKASCILAGARTLAGCLTPLKGTAPTNVGPFVTGDYNRITGLVGNGSTKYLDSNRKPSDQPQNSQHFSVYTTSIASTALTSYIGSTSTSPDSFSQIIDNNGTISFTSNQAVGNTGPIGSGNTLTGFFGANRSGAIPVNHRYPGGTTAAGTGSVAPNTLNFYVFARNLNGDANFFGDRRKTFYSIGESLNLENLDTRVTALMTAIGAALA